MWNIESNRTGWHKAIRELYQPFDMGTPQYYKGWWRRGFESKAYQDLFEAPEETTSEWGLGMTEDQVSVFLLYMQDAELMPLFPLTSSSSTGSSPSLT